MDNKKLGLILIGFSILLFALLGFTRMSVYNAYQSQIDFYGESCPSDPQVCPHQLRSRAMVPINTGFAIVFGILSLGFYLLFFEKSQREIISALEKQKHIQVGEERFNILLKGLDKDEQNVIKAIKEQDGITQQTLRLRANLHKSKLSIILDGLEKKGLIARKEKGKTKQVFLKINI